MMLDTQKVQVLRQSILGDDPLNSVMMDSQIEILKSENFALSIVKNLDLTKYPEFVDSEGGLIGVVRNVISTLVISDKDISNKIKPESEIDLTGRAAQVFEDRLTVAPRGHDVRYIEIGFKSIDPDRAAQIANAVADGFIVDQLEARYQTIRRATAGCRIA